MKKTIALLLALVMALGLCGFTTASAAEAVDPLTITFNISVSGEMYDLLSSTFAERCSELSDGAITVQIVAAGTLGSAREVVEACQLNSVNMIWAADSELDQVVGNLSWAWLPYTVINNEQADEYYNEGWIDEAIAALCKEAGIACVAGAENGFRLVCSAGTIIDSLDDMKGLKIRVPEQEPLVNFYTLCGSLPSTITANESFTAMQQGTVDGSDNTITNLYNLGFFDIIDCITLLNYQYSSAKICANDSWFESLTDAQRDIITEAATEAGLVQREFVRNQVDELITIAEDMGITVVEPDEEFQNDIKAAVSVMLTDAYNDYDEKVYPYIDKMIETFG